MAENDKNCHNIEKQIHQTNHYEKYEYFLT